MALFLLILNTKYRWVVNIKLRPLYLREVQRHPWIGSLDGSWADLDISEKK